MTHPRIMLILTSLIAGTAGWCLHGLTGHRGAASGTSHPADERRLERAAPSAQEDSSSAGRRRTQARDDTAKKAAAFRINMDGSITLSAEHADRLRIRLFDPDGGLDRGELALLGVDASQAAELQRYADDAKARELARQTEKVQVLRQDADSTTLFIPAGEPDGGTREAAEKSTREAVAKMLGEENELVAKSFSDGISGLTNSFHQEAMIVDTRLFEGKREYKRYTYRTDYGFKPPSPDQINPAALQRSAFGVRSYYSEEVPADLRHLFK